MAVAVEEVVVVDIQMGTMTIQAAILVGIQEVETILQPIPAVAPMGTLEVVATGTQTAFQVEAAMVGRPTATAEEEEVTEEQEQALVVRVVTRCRI